MFKWLKEKLTAAAQKQCKLNIRLNTKTLVAVANRVDEHMRASSGALNEADQRQVHNAQEALLKDIILGYSNGLSLEEINSSIIDPTLGEVEVSEGAQLAVEHVITSAAESLGVPSPVVAPEFNTSVTTAFLQGNVKIKSFDYDTTQFRLVENGALVSVRNDTHLRLVEDITKIPSMLYFEIIAPMTAVEVLEGNIPESYLHEYSLEHYLALRKHYTGE